MTLTIILAPEPARPATDQTLSGTRQALAQQGPGPEPTRPIAPETPTPEPPQTFAETSLTVSGNFLHAWRAGGGLAILGLPITAERQEIGDDGRLITVQWFERARLERPTAGDANPATVRFGLLGRQVLTGRPLTSVTLAATERARSFPETGQRVADPFLDYWERNGGLAVFGYPITGPVREASADDNRERIVQYFERARFEDHGPEATPRVRLGLVGREALAQPVRLWWEAEEALTHTFTTAFVYAGGGLGRDQALYVRDSAPAADGGRYRARYTVRAPRPDAYHFWGHLLTLDEASPLRWRVDDGAWQTVARLSPPVALINLQPPHRYAWYRLGTLALTAGWHSLEIEVATDGEAVAGLDLFTLTTVAGSPPAAAGTPPAQVAPPQVTLQATLDAPTTAWPRLHRGLGAGRRAARSGLPGARRRPAAGAQHGLHPPRPCLRLLRRRPARRRVAANSSTTSPSSTRRSTRCWRAARSRSSRSASPRASSRRPAPRMRRRPTYAPGASWCRPPCATSTATAGWACAIGRSGTSRT